MKDTQVKKLILLALIFGLLILSVACGNKEEGMVAIVDGEGITIGELDKKFDLVGIKEKTELQFGEGALDQEVEEGISLEMKLKEELLEQLVMVKIIAKNADKKVEITEDMLNKQKIDYIKDLGGEDKFKEFLEGKNITEKELEDYIKEDLVVKKYQENILNEINITEKDAKKYFEENKDDIISIKLEHILLKEEKEAENVLKRLKEGANFEEIAKKESIHTNSAENGGDIGYITNKSPIIEEYKKVGFGLKVGEISGIVKSELGYSIIKVTDRKEDFKLFEDDIINNLKMETLAEKIEEMKEKSNYKIIPENINIEGKDKEDKE